MHRTRRAGTVPGGARKHQPPVRRGLGKAGRLSIALTMVLGVLIATAGPAAAGVAVSVPPDFPGPVTVGQAGIPASITATNASTGLQATGPVTVTDLRLVPSCTNFNVHCSGGGDPGVFAPSPTGIGAANTACAGRAFTIALVDPAAGEYRFTPVDGLPLVLSPPGTPGGDSCQVVFTVAVLKAPIDTSPGTPGAQTNQLGFAVAISNVDGSSSPVNTGADATTVLLANPTVTTAASGSAPVGGLIADSATLTGVINPTGIAAIAFNLYGPGDPNCAGAPLSTSVVPAVLNGVYNSAPFTTTQAGTYRFVAVYSGDANNTGFATACADAAEAVTVTPGLPIITTIASPSVPVGGSIHDTATLTGGLNPTGTLTFNLFGPNDPTCAAAPVATFVIPVAGAGNYNSPNFVVPAPGTYRFRATYGGDVNNVAVGPTACAEPGESVTILANPLITTIASPSVPVGGTIHDTATIIGGITPTGTVTFNLFGPADPTCSGAPVFSSTVPMIGGGAVSADFTVTNTPTTGAGIYRFQASYSGDATNNPAGPTACNDPAETVAVTKINPQITTNASAPAAVGGTIFDTAHLAGGLAPTGTVAFNLFGPNDATCAGAPAQTTTVGVAGNGDLTSPGFVTTAAGVYRYLATYSGDANNAPAGPTACADPAETVIVTQVIPSLTTLASAPVGVGGAIHDTATLSGGVNPTGTITFAVYGPADPNCGAAPVFTATVPVAGAGNYDSPNFVATPASGAGIYRFRASYSGNADNAAVPLTACNDPAEQTTVTKLNPLLSTAASGTGLVGSVINDTAVLSGGIAPTGFVTFNLFGPGDVTCTGPALSTASVAVNGNGVYPAPPPGFTTAVAGTYRFVAGYSGDLNNNAASTLCADPAEQVLVAAAPSVITTASPSVPEGGSIHATATLAGGVAPTGTITFTLFGPDNPTCAGLPIFTSAVAVAGNGSYLSADFVTQINGPAGPGIYRFVATYSGDANNAAAGPTACGDPAAAVVVTNLAPVVQIVTSASPSTRIEPGGTFTFDLVITNPSSEPVTITNLVDSVYGNLSTLGTCTTSVGTVLAPSGGSYTCNFAGNFTGLAPDSQTDTATVTGTDNEGATVSGSDGAAVSLTPTLPSVAVVVLAAPASLPEPGGTYTFSVVVTNSSIKPLTVTALTDSVYGNLNGRGTCAVGASLVANGGTYNCAFPGVFNGVGGQTQTDTVVVTAVDRTGNLVSATDNAIVAITSGPPTITVHTSVTPASLPEPGGIFTFTATVNNTSTEALSLTSLVDDIYGNLNGTGTCVVPQTIVVGGSYTCTFPGVFNGLAPNSQADIATATVVDSQGRQATAADTAVVVLAPVLPTITTAMVADPATKPEPGGTFIFTVAVTNTSIKNVTVTGLNDNVYGDLNGQGTCAAGGVLAPGATSTCSFTGVFTGLAPAAQTDTVTATAVDNLGNGATANGVATVALTAGPTPPAPLITAPPVVAPPVAVPPVIVPLVVLPPVIVPVVELPPVVLPPVLIPPVIAPPILTPPVTVPTIVPPAVGPLPTTIIPPVTTPPVTNPTVGDFRLDKPSSPPGGRMTGSGRGCPPGAEVDMEVTGVHVATVRAEADGTFGATFNLPDLKMGRVPVIARCGPSTLSAPVDIALGTTVAQRTSVLTILLFFLLTSIGIARRRAD